MACLSKINSTQRSIEPWNIRIKWLLANATKGHKNLSGKRGRETWCDTFLSSVQCMSLLLPLQTLGDDLSAVRGHLVQMHYKNQLSKINWMRWWLQFIILKKQLKKCEKDDTLTTAQINCFSYQSLGTTSCCHKCHASFHTEKIAITLCLWDGEDMQSMPSQETLYKLHAFSLVELLSVCPRYMFTSKFEFILILAWQN